MTEYERLARELLTREPETIAEFKGPCTVHRWPKWMAFLALALIAVFVFAILQGCTAPTLKNGSTCTYITAKGVVLSRPCAPQERNKT